PTQTVDASTIAEPFNPIPQPIAQNITQTLNTTPQLTLHPNLHPHPFLHFKHTLPTQLKQPHQHLKLTLTTLLPKPLLLPLKQYPPMNPPYQQPRLTHYQHLH
ncbi:2-oxo acid dehydrogenase subunit E2, partial [Staphylococcus epidermidis]|uniref:2-oxo acid dehydrogenase subunit E2 n=1 Tax=Staphylococcus epidermidis TaxID=1282 RepID=UPI0016432D61